MSSDFDQKEQISRNLLMTLGPFSEPAIVFHFTAGTSTYNVSFLWVDPIGQIVDISEFHIEEGNVVNIKKNISLKNFTLFKKKISFRLTM